MADLIIPKIWEGKEICICVTDERAVFVYDKEQNKFIDTGETAIELPPHGRLIDAEKLQAVLSKWEEDARGRDNIELAYAYKTVREIIDDRDCVVEANNG